MHRDNRTKRISSHLIPSPSLAVRMFEQSGGSLTDASVFGSDPLAGNYEKQTLRKEAFQYRYPSFEQIFQDTINILPTGLFKEALKFYIDVTYRLSHTQ